MKTKKTSSKSLSNQKSSLFAQIPSILPKVKAGSLKAQAQVFVLGKEDKKKLKSLIQKKSLNWQKKSLQNSGKEVLQFIGTQGPVWIIAPKTRSGPVSHGGKLEDSSYAWMRDQAGGLTTLFKSYQITSVQIEFHEVTEEQELGFWVGLELAQYNYRQVIEELHTFPKISVKKVGASFSKEILKQAQNLAAAMNTTRHLVNTPPNLLNPASLSEFVNSRFSAYKNLSIEIWDEKKLAAEGMNLHLAVGSGALHPPCMVHLRYRPKNNSNKRPIAFVGKGITFDTGGLDIKPSAGMRLMKKDMGGAAAVLGLAQWAVESAFPRDLDFYLALAENSVDAHSFRPSDVFTARNGMKVEIHNTDAEGRLVLADVMDVAVTQKGSDEPVMVIDVATLTGAIKVALGADIAGLFSNHDSLADDLHRSGFERGELNWRMPLYGRYTSTFSSPFADMVNAVDGFGGAITAALFLEKFTRQKPWAHLDIYAWTDKAQGALMSSGGNGQAVQTLARFLQTTQS